MDIIQGKQTITHPSQIHTKQEKDYALQAYSFYRTTDPYLRPIRSTIYRLQSKTYPFLLPYLNRAASLAQDSPAIVTVGALLLFLLIAMRVLGFVHKIMMFWVR